MYRIFISYSSSERVLAEKVYELLSNAFEGTISFYISEKDIGTGEKWKESIRNSLKSCDTILCLLSTKFVEKKWYLLEWSCFWLQDKDIFIFSIGELEKDQLIEPMLDYEITDLFDAQKNKIFLKDLSIKSKFRITPYEIAEKIATECKLIYENMKYNELKEKSLFYKDHFAMLSKENNQVKESIIDYFYSVKDFDFIKKIILNFGDDDIKMHLIHKYINGGMFSKLTQIMHNLFEDSECYFSIFVKLVDNAYEEEDCIIAILEATISKQDLFKKMINYLVISDKEDTIFFNKIIDDYRQFFKPKQVGEILVVHNKINSKVFRIIIDFLKQANNADLKDLLIYIINCEEYYSNTFINILKEFKNDMPIQAEKVLNFLEQKDKLFFNEILH